MLFNVLLFPDGGWLVDPQAYNVESPPEYIWRSHQLDKLREICIPKVVMLLHTVMSEMNEHAECVKLSDIVASKQHKLYKVCLTAIEGMTFSSIYLFIFNSFC